MEMIASIVNQNTDTAQAFFLVSAIIFLIVAIMEKSLLAAGLTVTAIGLLFLA